MKRLALFSICALAGVLVMAGTASAIPILQIYIEGAVYDTKSETWVYSGFSDTGGGAIRLWAIGNVGGPGGKGDIADVKLAVAYANGINPTLSFLGSTTGGYGGFNDPSLPSVPEWLRTESDTIPTLGDGTSLPSHGIYGPGTTWQEWLLGDMTEMDSPMGDFIGSFPTSLSGLGQINVYEITIGNVKSGDFIHFDLYNHVEAKNDARYIFAPFSHDADGQTDIVPEPSTLFLLGSGICAVAAFARIRRGNR